MEETVEILTGENLKITPNTKTHYTVDKDIEAIVSKALVYSLCRHGYAKESIKILTQEMESYLLKNSMNPPENKPQDLISFYKKYSQFDFNKFFSGIKHYLENPQELSTQEQKKLDDFYSILYALA